MAAAATDPAAPSPGSVSAPAPSPERTSPPRRRPGGPTLALARRAFLDARVRTLGFTYLFAFMAYLQPVAYRHSYPALADRLKFAAGFGDNKALRLFYGMPHAIGTVGGYTAWRVGGTLAILAGVWGLLAAIRALRAEEEAGRTELVLAAGPGRATVYGAALAAIAAGALLLTVACTVGLIAAGLAPGGSILLSVSIVSVAAALTGVGALASQLAPTRRTAIEIALGAFAVLFALRVIADTASGAGWLRWLTPLGWAEEVRAFDGARPLVLLLPLAATALLLALSLRLALRRDIGRGLLQVSDTAAPRTRLLGSPIAHALRMERTTLVTWALGIGAFGAVLGVISKSVSSAVVSKQIEQQIAKLGIGTKLTPEAYIGFAFAAFILALSMFTVAQIATARHEEADGRLETILAHPTSRMRWLGGRIALAGVALAVLALVAALGTWAGAQGAGVGLSLPRMLLAGANALPVPVLYLGLAALGFALVPRAGTAIAYGLVILGYLWQLLGALLGAPRWLVEISPFQHVGFVPAVAGKPVAAVVMVAIGMLAAGAALAAFRRRDLAG